ncbi:MAG TPA: MBL fold metallo-hydrolase, partial [Pseudomonas sp.]|nr:MBL fold metallo-hydrolase [Pseudomonas sp.]
LETYVQADNLFAVLYPKDTLGGRIAIGACITQVQKVFGSLFNAEPGFARDGSQFDVLFDDEEIFHIGNLQAKALHTPGHT